MQAGNANRASVAVRSKATSIKSSSTHWDRNSKDSGERTGVLFLTEPLDKDG